jgi:hypothetical protein
LVKRALLRTVGGTALAAVATLTIVGPAYGDARTDVTDLKVTVDPVHGKVGDTISVDLGLYDSGPSIAVEGTVTSHVVAPAGTELTDAFASVPYCHVVTPGHEVWCTNPAQFWPPEYVSNGALIDYIWTVRPPQDRLSAGQSRPLRRDLLKGGHQPRQQRSGHSRDGRRRYGKP